MTNMSMFICSLNSGSNANCYYLGNQDEAILVDGGLSCRETEKRMKRLGLNIRKIKAIFVSHEHGDHVHGIPALSKKYQLPVYITPETFRQGRLEIKDHLVIHLRAYDPVRIGNLSILAFPKLHDASDPHSFLVECFSVKVGIFTDIGMPCDHVVNHFQQCHAAFLEANYDETMLTNGSYPIYLKNRIRGEKGHMSNDQAVELFTRHKPPFMSHLFLSHLSRDNNSPKLVKSTFTRIAGRTQIVIASRDRESPVYHIRQTLPRPLLHNHLAKTQQQLSLFQ
ncbi:MAG TPA: MBL fold metallo-hydrolase [Chryseosolibacter sp.]|nr:MBL fold metallo-hydrolase [Chryseosolibacter sp.]